MRTWITTAAAIGGIAILCGCNNNPGPRGGPGATNRGTAPGSASTGNTADTFTLGVPSGSTDVSQGDRNEVTISIDRGANFKQPVKIEFKAPQGIKINPAEATIQPAENNVKVFVEVAADAPVGEKTVEVTAAPESGKSIPKTFVVNVKPKKG